MTYEGPNIFRAPMSSSDAQENFNRTVIEGVDADVIAPFSDFDPEIIPVRVWGTVENNRSTWEDVSENDFLIFYNSGTYEYAAEVIGTEENEDLARELWPNFEDDEPWLCIIYLREPVELGISSAEIHNLAGYDTEQTQGFSPLNNMGIGGIRGKYGSVESFIYGAGSEAEIDIQVEPDFHIHAQTLDGLYFPPQYTKGAEEIVQQINDALNAGKHIIFTGPPGTGKTEIARRVASNVVSSHSEAYTGYEMTTATADWSTFETVGGYMPEEEGGGALDFNPGQVLRCFKRQGRQRNDLLIIDEINRSDIDKSFGQLFTLLSGHGVELPFTQGGDEIEIFPASKSNGSPASHQYVVPRSWRIFATMNSYDKASLYEMSYAFMRRFAFIYVEAPQIPGDEDGQRSLVKDYASEWGIDGDEDLYGRVGEIWHLLNVRVDERPIGPAIIRDILSHVVISEKDRSTALTDALTSYVYPQLEGVRRRKKVVDALSRLEHIESDRLRDVAGDVLQVEFDE